MQESELRQKLADAEADAAQSRGAEARLRERCDTAEAAAEDARRQLRAVKEEAAAAHQVLLGGPGFATVIWNTVDAVKITVLCRDSVPSCTALAEDDSWLAKRG